MDIRWSRTSCELGAHRDASAEALEISTARSSAFACLEEEAEGGAIGCYGVSSNTLPLSTDDPAVPNLRRLLAIARRTSLTHHFRIVQFPFNIVEQDALRPHHDGASLIELEHRLEYAGLADEAALRLLDYLRRDWDSLTSPELVDDLFARRLWPLLGQVYENPPPPAEGDVHARFPPSAPDLRPQGPKAAPVTG